ncbi:hypothetical protein VUR80DRAFT_9493 [Thermomyces stellatus]
MGPIAPETGGAVKGRAPPRVRAKRAQVVRACDWCRKQRIKCDNDQPCFNCRSRGAVCSNEVIKTSTLPQAYREIDRLRRQVRGLERQLQQERARATSSTGPYLLSPSNPGSFTPDTAPVGAPSDNSQQHKYWQGIYVRTARSQHETWYGPSSLYYFLGRIANFMNATMLQSDPVYQMLPSTSASVLFDGSAGDSVNDSRRRPADSTEDTMTARAYLSPTQEEYFLDLYWQAYHTCLFPILHESEFTEHYRSLFTTPGQPRKPSALVDIVLALCMQRGVSAVPSIRGQKPVAFCDASVAGRQHFRRYRRLVQYEMESPTISTLQSCVLCGIYFCNGTFMNMADNECGLAVRIAYMLGLHREPPPTMSLRERELRKRVWWSLYVLDTKIGVKLGRPFLLSRTDAEPSLPDDSRNAAMESGSHFAAPDDETTWLSFSVQQLKLFMTAREAHTAFYGENLDIRDDQTIWDNPDVLEAHARFMQPYESAMEDWANSVPSALKTKRQDNGQPLSTDGSPLDIEQFAPLWLQRQRLLLELLYHTLRVYQCRPFITFTPAASSAPINLAGQAATKAALHAITLTRILHDVISSTSILTGWHEAFQWQWNAAVTLVGFVLAYPHSPTTPAARSAIDLSVAVFEMFSSGCVVSGGAADITRNLISKLDLLAQQVCGAPGGVDGWVASNSATPSVSSGFNDLSFAGGNAPKTSMPRGAMDVDSSDVMATSVQDVFQMALAVDQWSGLDLLWPPGDMWTEGAVHLPSPQ